MDSAEYARLVVANMPFAAVLQIQFAELAPQLVRATMAWAPERCTTGGMLHGGALMAFADTAGAVCAVMNLPRGAATSTIESKTNFFRAVRDGTVTATSVPLHVGRSTIVVQTDLGDDDGGLVARVTQTQAVLAAKAR
ncbi:MULTISPECIES: PaaI family thioesterase [Mycolicibacter]|uniref:Aromatic compound degradation protein PaaI n=2 Tax=Mycolicibacter TaxID=1073531 RepID=A0A1X1TZA3_9MYCO|nr:MULTISPECIES: PaaI family thioesterase [Mycolicibacter]MCV7084782.1 PaaI family thioesterase [Mycolicibacter hiberniae]ORV49893.1 aromatic compound degradation protein PaaI [Mycolicibacter engbaekii]ORV71428.1 aromatic compound degradation protein PaaI [Mycolicibacter hiberniae]BBZ23380.1 aromatic compound degradation protein PaaI [Mycolicibacter hiberniae]